MPHPRPVPEIPPCPAGCRKCVAPGWRARENDQPRAEVASDGHKAPASEAQRYRQPLRRSDTGGRRRRCCGRAYPFLRIRIRHWLLTFDNLALPLCATPVGLLVSQATKTPAQVADGELQSVSKNVSKGAVTVLGLVVPVL